MSDSVVPTPSDTPMCKHGFDRWHDFEIYDGGQTPGESPDFRGRCPGPVIATPEKCAHKTWRSDVGKWVRRCSDCGLIRDATVEETRDVSTEPETPVTEATCEVRLEQDGRLRVTAWVRPDQMYATLSALQSTASDPTPELRERIANAIFKSDFANVDWELHDHKDAYYRTADAVLDELGEPK